MPWKETCPMDERIEFIGHYLSGDLSVTELCAQAGISRRVGHKWIRRYEHEGPSGLQERSRARHHQAHRTPADQVKRIVTARKRFGWCASKLKAYLQNRWPHESWPAASTIGDILGREGLIKPRPKRRLKAMPSRLPLIEPQAPNELWTIDFKGQFQLGNRRWCFPLTLVDDYSRYVLCCDGVSKVSREQILPSLRKAFRRYGLPQYIRSDNGPPFATNGVVGLSKLGVWWTKLGIRQERIHPGKPQQNGRHERMHRTLKQEALAVIQADMPQQQRALNRWRKNFNEIPPHQQNQNRQQTQLYQPTARDYREPTDEIS